MGHLEELLIEYYEWQGYFVKRNALVGKLAKGGWEMELDIIAYCPQKKELLHIEPSLDAYSWEKREARFKKKFGAGRRYILKDIFQWLPQDTEIKQIAIFVAASAGHRTIAGGSVLTVDEMVGEIKREVLGRGIAAKQAISERFPLLRTIQFIVSGYYRVVDVGSPD